MASTKKKNDPIELERFMRKLGERGERFIRSKLMKRWRYRRPPQDKDILYYRARVLRNSISSKMSTGIDSVTVEVGPMNLSVDTRRIAWSIAEDGPVTMRPVRRRYMAIPLRQALDQAGVKLAPSPRDWAMRYGVRLRVMRTPSLAATGRALLYYRQGKRIVPVYLLAKKVKVPARHILQQFVDQFLAPELLASKDLFRMAKIRIGNKVVRVVP